MDSVSTCYKYYKYKSKLRKLNKKYKQNGGNSDIDQSNDSDNIEYYVRMKILKKYKNQIHPPLVSPNKFTDLVMIENTINIPYNERGPEDIGLYYADDYIKLKKYDDKLWRHVLGLANPYYWDVRTLGAFFKGLDNSKPSDLMNSFFEGPTFPDCGNVLQVVLYQYILNIVGEDKFNELFGKPLTQFVITKWVYEPFVSESKKEPIGNPLFFLLDKIYDNENDKSFDFGTLRHGDMLYIQGVPDYKHKHLCGFRSGENLICVKPNDVDEVRFIGFGPITMANGPLTYEEIRRLLIYFYNEDQSFETLYRMKQMDSNNNRLKKALKLKNDKKPNDYIIGGIQVVVRLNKDKLHKFINNENGRIPWYSDITISHTKPSGIIPYDIVNSPSNLTDANADVNMIYNENYKYEHILKKFTYKMCTSLDYPIGLIICDNKFNKKYLLSIAKFINSHNKKILFIDNIFLEREEFSNLDQYDLIILYDIDTTDRIGSEVYKIILKMIFNTENSYKQNIGLIIMDKNCVNTLQYHLPYYINYNDKYADCFVVLK